MQRDHDPEEHDPGIDCEPDVEDPDCPACLASSLHQEIEECANRLELKADAYQEIIHEMVAKGRLPAGRAAEIGQILGSVSAAINTLRGAQSFWKECLEAVEDHLRSIGEGETLPPPGKLN
jgi:hypothetical protein